MHDGFSYGPLKDRSDEKRGDQGAQQDHASDSRVSLQAVTQLLQIGTDKDGTGRLSLEHNLADYYELAILKPVAFYLTGGNGRQRQVFDGAIAPVHSERSALRSVDACRYDVGGRLQ